MKYYIAYGSNLSHEQMKRRCSNAIPVGTATLKNWQLVFRFHATIEPKIGSEVPVGIWAIDKWDEHHLDVYEGYPAYYDKRNLTVTMKTLTGDKQAEVTAMVYIMKFIQPIMPPADDYYYGIHDGYEDFGLTDRALRRAFDDSVYGYCKKTETV